MKGIRGWITVVLAFGLVVDAALSHDYGLVSICLLWLILAGLRDVAEVLREIRGRQTQTYVASLIGADPADAGKTVAQQLEAHRRRSGG